MTEDEQIQAAIEMSMNDQKMKQNNEPITIEDDDEYYEFDDEDFASVNNSQIDETEENEMETDNKGKMKEEEAEDEGFVIDESLTKDELCEKCKYISL